MTQISYLLDLADILKILFRSNDAATLIFGHATSWAITIPPKSEDFVIVGHCSPRCSSNIPESGINVFSIAPHSHLAGISFLFRVFYYSCFKQFLNQDEK